MKPPEPSLAVAEKLLALTMVLEDAVTHGRVEELDGILEDRQSLLDALQAADLDADAKRTIDRVKRLEETLPVLLGTLKGETLEQLRGIGNTKKGLKSYRSQRSA